MPLQVTRLRRWFAAGAIAMIVIVAGMYLFARWKVRNVVVNVPKKLDLNIQQTAEGFSISKSQEGRTLFTVSASKAVQFKEGGHAELHDVKITVFGKDASRFDRITGADFEYDPKSGNVTAKGLVEIDLEANPEGVLRPDQAPPAELKNPIHIRTSGLVFNRNSGDASTSDKLEFSTPQAAGSAVGIQYVAQSRTLTFGSSVVVDLGEEHTRLEAEHAVVTHEPREIVLNHPKLIRDQQTTVADRATVFLREDNTVDHVLAEGDVRSDMHGHAEAQARADQMELSLNGRQNELNKVVLVGNVRFLSAGAQQGNASAGRVILHFGQKQILRTIHAEGGVQLVQDKASVQGPSTQTANVQRLEMTAPVMDFVVKNGKLLDYAETMGPPQIVLTQSASQQKTIISAAKFTAEFAAKNRLAKLHGAPDARIVSTVPNQPDRTSTSETLDLMFAPTGGISSIVQRGNMAYVDGSRKAWAQQATYSAADQLLVLTGSPRIEDTGMTTTAQTIRIRRATGDATAEGNVKSTYVQEKSSLASGALFASSDPIHVTSRSVTATRSPAAAVYTGNARIWQNGNVVEAPSLTFHKELRQLVAQGNATRPVSTVLVQVDRSGKATLVTITAPQLAYRDPERMIALDGGVTAKGSGVTMTAQKMDVFLKDVSKEATKDQAKSDPLPGGPGQLDRILAQGNIVITEPARRATGERLEYVAVDDKFVLTGGPPSIFDAERGKITGDSLTFFRRDDRVLVEGRETSPTVTRTRVAR